MVGLVITLKNILFHETIIFLVLTAAYMKMAMAVTALMKEVENTSVTLVNFYTAKNPKDSYRQIFLLLYFINNS